MHRYNYHFPRVKIKLKFTKIFFMLAKTFAGFVITKNQFLLTGANGTVLAQ